MAKKARLAERKKPKSSSYDDETIENMLKYYRLGDNHDSLLKYIKNMGLHADDLELV